MFNKVIEISMLYDFYGQLLTEKQRDVMHLYYEDDLSLGEIAENLNVSRQAVYDTIKKSEKSLKEYESKLKLVKRYKADQNSYKQAMNLIEEVINDYKHDIELKSKLESIKKIINKNNQDEVHI